GLKLGIGRGLIGVVVAELFGSRAGLGRLIAQSADAFNMPELFAGVIVLAAAGIALTAGFGWVESRLVPWTKDSSSPWPRPRSGSGPTAGKGSATSTRSDTCICHPTA